MNIDKKNPREQMTRAKTAILASGGKEGLRGLIDKDRDAFAGMRILYASDVEGVPIQRMLSNNGDVVSIFSGSGIFAYSDEIGLAETERAALGTIGIRPLIDTNLFSDLPRFLAGEHFDSRERVNRILDYLSSTFGPEILDWTFASLENMREAAKPQNPWPIRKSAAALHYLVHKKAARELDRLDEFSSMATNQWNDWLQSDLMWRQVRRRDTMYLVMLLSFMEAWCKGTVIESLRRMMTFCVDYLGVVPLKELYFGWKLLRGIHQPEFELEIFDESPLRHPSSKSLARINAVAWDLFLFRWCETQMTEKPKLDSQLGASFYLPVVTTMDSGLLHAIRACPLKAVLVHDRGQIVESIFEDELEFQVHLNEAMTPDIHKQINDPVRSSNVKNFDFNVQKMAIQTLEDHLGKMVN